MTHPDPAQRFQTARQVIDAIDAGPGAAGDAEDDEATVIAPRPAPRAQIAGVAPLPAGPAPAAPRRSRTWLLVGGTVLPAMAVLAGLWMAGMLDRAAGPRYPEVAPFALTVGALPDAPVTASGFVPTPDMQLALTNLAELGGGTVDLALATGAIADSWPADVLRLIEIVLPLDSWQLSVTDNAATVTGQTGERSLRDTVLAGLEPFPGALSGSARIDHVQPPLTAGALTALMDGLADCGPLELAGNPPAAGYAPEAAIGISGMVSSENTLAALQAILSAAAEGRSVDLDDVSVLNPTLCLIENFLPQAPPSDIAISFANGGDILTPNPEGAFVVGDNPVIDVTLPAGMTDGYIAISIIDVSGDVFHLLPNLSRPQASVAELRAGQTGPLDLRVAYDVATAQAEGLIGFQVDDSALGKSKIVVIHSTGPLFDTMRPTSESASGYAQALRDGQAATDARILSLDSRILTTALP